MTTPGYSGTPLPKKLGLKAGQRVLFLDLPGELGALKRAAVFAECVSGGWDGIGAGGWDVIHGFTASRAVTSVRALVVMLAVCLPVGSVTAQDTRPVSGVVTVGALVGCWRHYDTDIGNAKRITLPGGDPGLYWGVDAETGEELIGAVPHSELCFNANGSLTTAKYGVDEGLLDTGTYRFDGKVLAVHSESPGDGWLFGSGSTDARCVASTNHDELILADCSPASEWLDRAYTRAKQ